MKKILTGAALFFCTLAAFAVGWKCEKRIDAMTDETVLTFSSVGTILNKESAGIYFYDPTILLTMRGDVAKGIESFTLHPALSIALAKFRQGSMTHVTVRFGKGRPERHMCSTFSQRRAARLPASVGAAMLTNATMLVRYETVDERLDDVRFDLTGLRPAIEEARRSFSAPAADPPKPAALKSASETPRCARSAARSRPSAK